MDTALDTRARLVFDEVLDVPAPQRDGELSRLCGADAALRRRVEGLLAAAEKEDDFLRDHAAGDRAAAEHEARGEGPGSRIGPYRLLEQIGEGGFGAVFMAEQDEPVRRRIALKIVKLGMDTRAVVARFEQERQALALMDHPNIARVLDAGATPAGRPYFVMELVRGDPVSTFCDSQRLGIAERLALFAQVCRAVQHAHTKGVIHRDLKPQNILVSMVDGRPLAKVIDFGIAKATERRLTDRTLFTEFRQFIGTPEYMSPEQAAGSLDIDTRTDVYALGVLLYELLTGATPFDARTLRSAAFEEMQRMIREVDPPPPSTRLARLGQSIGPVAAARATAPQRLSAIIRGDLDWVVMKALEKDRARRYDTTGALADDVERYLGGFPIEAAPPSTSYRIRKLLRRNRVAVLAGAAVLTAIVAGAGVAVWQARIASAERDSARARERETQQVAEFEAARLRSIDPDAMGRQIIDDLRESVRSSVQRGNADPAEVEAMLERFDTMTSGANPADLALRTLDRTIFEGSLRAVDEQFADQPLVRARLLHTLGAIMLEVSLLDRASAPLEEAVRVRTGLLGATHVDTLAAMQSLAGLRQAQTRHADAETIFRAILTAHETTIGPDARETISAANELGVAMLFQGKLAEAEGLYRDLHRRAERTLDDGDELLLGIMNSMGGLMMETGRAAEAEPYFRSAVEGYRRRGALDEVNALLSLSNLGFSIERQGRPAEAETFYREAMERSQRVNGDEHWQTLLFKSNLGYLLASLGRVDEGGKLTLEVLATRRRLLGNEHGDTLQSVHNAGVLMVARGEPQAAESHFREAIEGRLTMHDGAHWSVLQSVDELAKLMIGQSRFTEAEALLLEAHRSVAESADAPPAQRTARASALADLYAAWDSAEPGRGHAESAARWRSLAAEAGR